MSAPARKRLWMLLLWCVATLTATAQTDGDIRTVTLYLNGAEMERPFVRLGSTDRLQLSFDQLGSQPDAFRYRIRHCDANGDVDDLQPYDFIEGFDEGNIDDYRPSFGTRQAYIHYTATLPAPYSRLTASGNYVVQILTEENDSVVAEHPFCVYEELFDIELAVGRPSTTQGDIFRDQDLSVALTGRNHFSVANLTHFLRVVVQQNKRRDLCRDLQFSGYDGGRMMFRWQEASLFPGGNDFRFVDISNLNSIAYNIVKVDHFGDETFVMLRPEEDKSKRVYTSSPSLNGGMKVNVWDRNDPPTEADYVWVNFSLPLASPFLDRSVHLVGELTDWRLDDGSRMEWRPEYRTYTLRLLLKQGYYAYQLLTLRPGEKQASTADLEGDHFETPNDYTVFVYLHQPGDRYDRLVATKTLLGR